MESNIRIKAKLEHIDHEFENPQTGYYIKYYKQVSPMICECLIRHRELENDLTGTFTLKQLNNMFRN